MLPCYYKEKNEEVKARRRKIHGKNSEKRFGDKSGLTFVETSKLISKAPLDFFKGFFDMVVAGRKDYPDMTKALLC